MRQIAPGLWHWTARHPRIHSDVSSYYLERERVVIDPMLPAEGLDWFAEHGCPEHVVMSNRHHDRDAWRLREAFGSTVHCPRVGVGAVRGRGPIEPFDVGAQLPGALTVHEVDAICPDEMALYIATHSALACADGVVSFPDDDLGFVPDELMDDPEETKQGLRQAYRRLLELDFDVLLLAHGEPVVGGGKDALRAFVEAGT